MVVEYIIINSIQIYLLNNFYGILDKTLDNKQLE